MRTATEEELQLKGTCRVLSAGQLMAASEI